jgi:hypothetical protein
MEVAEEFQNRERQRLADEEQARKLEAERAAQDSFGKCSLMSRAASSLPIPIAAAPWKR